MITTVYMGKQLFGSNKRVFLLQGGGSSYHWFMYVLHSIGLSLLRGFHIIVVKYIM